MQEKMTRRQVGIAALTAAATPAQQAASADDELAAARKQIQRNAEALAKFEIPMQTEPAFVFKA